MTPAPNKSNRKKAGPVTTMDDRIARFHQLPMIMLSVIITLTIFIYSPTLRNGIMYGWDDGIYTEDSFVKDLSLQSIGHFFSSYYLGMYQPLAVLSLSINKAASQNEALAYHATNLLLHLVNIILVFIFIRRLTRKIVPAITVALLFAIHPMETEAVAWIAARSTLLFTLFYLLALIFYLRSYERKKKANLAYTFLFFLLACFTKSMAVTLPLVLLLVDYYRGKKWTAKIILEKIPFLAVSVIFGIVSIMAAKSYGHISELGIEYNLIDRLFLLSYGIVFYLFKAVFPVNLSAIYAYPLKDGNALPLVYYLSTIFLVVLVFLLIVVKKHRRELLFGILFYLLTISIVLPLFWSRIFIVAERYSYLTYIGLYFIIAYFIDLFLENRQQIYRNIKPYFVGTVIIIFFIYGYESHQRSKIWRETRDILTEVIVKDRSPSSVATAYFYRGNFRDMIKDFKGALKDYDKAITINPSYTIAINNRGIVKGIQGDLEGAVEDFSLALSLRPGYPDAFYNRGLAYMQMQQMDKACADWSKAVSFGGKAAQRFIDQYCK